MTHESVSDVLDDAADYIEQHGWCQESMDGTSRCLSMAMSEVAPSDALWKSAFEAVERAVGIRGVSLICWNDHPGRTKQEVLDALRAAAKAERRLADGLDS